MRHSVDQALVQAIQPIKHHLLGLVDQQAWSAPAGAIPMGEPSFSADSQSAKHIPNPHAADFQSLFRNMAREHDYNAGSLKKAGDAPASSSASSSHSSEQEDAPPQEVRHQQILVAVMRKAAMVLDRSRSSEQLLGYHIHWHQLFVSTMLTSES
ncbi:hypothetical protein NDU88_007991 [Pleurodeles waltl]|uniref:Uncharacterized protein n=1 Tax=Pleurodeles waltl TaxID=8319 RepID=A0AAV7N8F4_PLEWA|nr:hypothetical protein NDU88_007991 [Pleurodeles waltl]